MPKTEDRNVYVEISWSKDRRPTWAVLCHIIESMMGLVGPYLELSLDHFAEDTDNCHLNGWISREDAHRLHVFGPPMGLTVNSGRKA